MKVIQEQDPYVVKHPRFLGRKICPTRSVHVHGGNLEAKLEAGRNRRI
jgi:hypothetical protein